MMFNTHVLALSALLVAAHGAPTAFWLVPSHECSNSGGVTVTVRWYEAGVNSSQVLNYAVWEDDDEVFKWNDKAITAACTPDAYTGTCIYSANMPSLHPGLAHAFSISTSLPEPQHVFYPPSCAPIQPITGLCTKKPLSCAQLYMFGDVGTGVNSDATLAAIVAAQAPYTSPGSATGGVMCRAKCAVASMLLGDVSYADGTPGRWDSFAVAAAPLMGSTAVYISPGNHEWGAGVQSEQAAYTARYSSSTPAVGNISYAVCSNLSRYSVTNQYYSFNVASGAAGIHVLVLNAYDATLTNVNSAQFQFAVRDLACVNRSVTPFVVVALHPPLYHSNTRHQGETGALLTALEPLFWNTSVDLVSAGHVHAMQVTKPVACGTEQPGAPVYLTMGAGGNSEGLYNTWNPAPSWSAFTDDTHYGYATLNVLSATAANLTLWSNAAPSVILFSMVLTRSSASRDIFCGLIPPSPSMTSTPSATSSSSASASSSSSSSGTRTQSSSATCSITATSSSSQSSTASATATASQTASSSRSFNASDVPLSATSTASLTASSTATASVTSTGSSSSSGSATATWSGTATTTAEALQPSPSDNATLPAIPPATAPVDGMDTSSMAIWGLSATVAVLVIVFALREWRRRRALPAGAVIDRYAVVRGRTAQQTVQEAADDDDAGDGDSADGGDVEMAIAATLSSVNGRREQREQGRGRSSDTPAQPRSKPGRAVRSEAVDDDEQPASAPAAAKSSKPNEKQIKQNMIAQAARNRASATSAPAPATGDAPSSGTKAAAIKPVKRGTDAVAKESDDWEWDDDDDFWGKAASSAPAATSDSDRTPLTGSSAAAARSGMVSSAKKPVSSAARRTGEQERTPLRTDDDAAAQAGSAGRMPKRKDGVNSAKRAPVGPEDDDFDLF